MKNGCTGKVFPGHWILLTELGIKQDIESSNLHAMAIVIIRQDRRVPEWVEALSKAAPDIPIFNFKEKHPKEEVVMAIVWKHPQGILADYPNLRCIASFGAGVDFIFEDPGIPAHLPVTRVVDPKLASDMSEFVLAVILNYLKNLDVYKADQIQNKWRPRPYRRIEDIRVGIMGLGALGMELAVDLLKLNFRVLGWAGSGKDIPGVPVYVGENQRSGFLSQADILVCLLPLTEETRGILNIETFMALPTGAYVINVARGGHLVDDDLLEAIGNGHLSGACLDVFHSEPLGKDHPFWVNPAIHMTPHIASVSDVASVIPQLIDNYRRLIAGDPLQNLVSREKGY